MCNSTFHHKPLPDHSTLLCGKNPPDSIGFKSEEIQIWYNNTEEEWTDNSPHYHTLSDECFVILKGSLIVEVEGKQMTINEREFCCFPKGIVHSVIKVFPPIEAIMFRAPSVEDKVYI